MSDVSRETSKPENTAPPEKNKRSSFYAYLLILFGAAFLMLLLAYFVQQRSSETTISDLRDTMNLSREDLMKQIGALEGEKQALQEERDALETQLGELERENAALTTQLAAEESVRSDSVNRIGVLTAMSILEQAIRDKNYDLAAQKARILCQGDWNLDLGIVNLDGSEYFDPRERLAEVIPLLEKQGALAPDEVTIP